MDRSNVLSPHIVNKVLRDYFSHNGSVWAIRSREYKNWCNIFCIFISPESFQDLEVQGLSRI